MGYAGRALRRIALSLRPRTPAESADAAGQPAAASSRRSGRSTFARDAVRVTALVGLLLAVMVVSFGAGVWAAPYVRAQVTVPATPPSEDGDHLAPFWQSWRLVQDHFAFKDNVDPQKMAYGAIRGMIDTLDDEGHTRFLSPAEVKLEDSNLHGKFEGIGAELTSRDGRPTIVAPIEGSPAERAGLRPGDVMVRVDGEDVADLTLSQIVSRVRGPRGTTVRLDVIHPGQTVITSVTIVRDEVSVPMVTWAIVPGTSVAHVRIAQFGHNVSSELRQALKDARAAGATSLIVDVRNNPGGLLDQAIGVTSEFQDGGVVLLQEDREGNRKSYPARRGGTALDLPMVVLANEGSASAAEIFAGAMQDNGRARVVGARTVGTGTVLSPYPLSDGSTLLLGTAQWLTPGGRAIRKEGIQPDVEVPLPADVDLLSPRVQRTSSPEAVRGSEDAQFLRALELLEAQRN